MVTSVQPMTTLVKQPFSNNRNRENDVPTIDTLDNLTINEDATLRTVVLSGIAAGEMSRNR